MRGVPIFTGNLGNCVYGPYFLNIYNVYLLEMWSMGCIWFPESGYVTLTDALSSWMEQQSVPSAFKILI